MTYEEKKKKIEDYIEEMKQLCGDDFNYNILISTKDKRNPVIWSENLSYEMIVDLIKFNHNPDTYNIE